MKKKYILIVIVTLLAVFAVSCYNVSEPCVEADDFFPLRIGDKFLYKLSPKSHSNYLYPTEYEVSVTSTVDTLGKTYYVIENYFSVNNWIGGKLYVRNEDNNVYFLDKSGEILYYRFNASLNSEYPIILGAASDSNWHHTPAIIKKISYDTNYLKFFIGLTPEHPSYKNYKSYITFERGKGRTQVVTQSLLDDGTIYENIIYDLVEVY